MVVPTPSPVPVPIPVAAPVTVPVPTPVYGTGTAGVEFGYGGGYVGYGGGYDGGHGGGYEAAGTGTGGMPVDMGPAHPVPPHAGYYSHPAGNVEHWRVTEEDDSKKDKKKDKSNSGSDKSDKSSKSSKSSKTKYPFYMPPAPPENTGFDNTFLYAGKEYGNDGGAGEGVRAGGNYAKNGPVPVPGASYLASLNISPHISDDVEEAIDPPAEDNKNGVAKDTPEEVQDGSPKSSKGKGKMPIPSCWVESASSSTVSLQLPGSNEETDRESRLDRFRSRRDDSGRIREGSWERISPQVQREREWQRLQDEERGRLEREAEAEAYAEAVAEAVAEADAEQSHTADLNLSESSNSSGTGDSCSYSLADFQVNPASVPIPASHTSSSSQSDYLTIVDSPYFAHIDSRPKCLTAPAPGSVSSVSSAKSKPAPASASCPTLSAIPPPYSISGDTGYETGHEADSEANRLSNETQVYDDPGYGSMYSSACGGGYGKYDHCENGCGAYYGYDDGATWGGLESSSTTLLSSSASGSTKERTSEKGDEARKGNKSKKDKKGKKDKKDKSSTKSKSETSSSSSTSGRSRASHRSKSSKNDGGLLAKIVGW